MSTPTSETLNGGSTFTPEQTSGANESSKGIDLVEATRPRPSADQRITAGMTTGSQVNVGPIKPVDRKTITGSTPGDFRAKAAPAVLPDNPAPREQMGQQRSSKFDGNAKPFESSTAGSEGDRA